MENEIHSLTRSCLCIIVFVIGGIYLIWHLYGLFSLYNTCHIEFFEQVLSITRFHLITLSYRRQPSGPPDSRYTDCWSGPAIGGPLHGQLKVFPTLLLAH